MFCTLQIWPEYSGCHGARFARNAPTKLDFSFDPSRSFPIMQNSSVETICIVRSEKMSWIKYRKKSFACSLVDPCGSTNGGNYSFAQFLPFSILRHFVPNWTLLHFWSLWTISYQTFLRWPFWSFWKISHTVPSVHMSNNNKYISQTLFCTKSVTTTKSVSSGVIKAPHLWLLKRPKADGNDRKSTQNGNTRNDFSSQF
jgi:hypothetical protein